MDLTSRQGSRLITHPSTVLDDATYKSSVPHSYVQDSVGMGSSGGKRLRDDGVQKRVIKTVEERGQMISKLGA